MNLGLNIHKMQFMRRYFNKKSACPDTNTLCPQKNCELELRQKHATDADV